MNKIGGLEVQQTGKIFTPDSRLNMLVFAEPKTGKTRFGATLDELTQKYMQKRTLYIACEPGHGGGTGSIREYDVPFVQPMQFQDVLNVLSQLTTDTTYGGVVLDSASELVKGSILPWSVQNLPSKMKSRARDEFGTPAPDDYQNAGELLRQVFNKLLVLSTLKDVNCRKHVLCTATLKIKSEFKTGDIIKITPDLPGQMADTANAIFQTIGTIHNVRKVIGGKNQVVGMLCTDKTVSPELGKYIIGDRYGLLPPLTELNLCKIYEEHWVPRFETK